MRNIVTLVGRRETNPITPDIVDMARDVLAEIGGTPSLDTDVLAAEWAVEIPVDGVDLAAARATLERAEGLDGVDKAVRPDGDGRKKVLVADMDSTMIAIETLDTMAAELGFGPQVAEITARSMNGELDFIESLRERVLLLEGFDAREAMDAVMAQVVHTEGAERTVKTMAAHGCRCALVSGGFTFTTEVVHAALGFHRHAANTLEIGADGRFTGRLTGDLVGRETKLQVLDALCAEQGVGRDRAAAIGDGANDLDMITAAGLGVGFHPKPVVRDRAGAVIEHTDMTTLLFYQGYREADFVI
jgi:phosphoserine phosphatase